MEQKGGYEKGTNEGRNGKDKIEGKLLTKQGEIKARWQVHFMEVLNRAVPGVVAKVDETNVVNDSIVIG